MPVSRQLLQSASQEKKAIELLQAQELEAKKAREEKAGAYSASGTKSIAIGSQAGSLQVKNVRMAKELRKLSLEVNLQSAAFTKFVPALQAYKERQKLVGKCKNVMLWRRFLLVSLWMGNTVPYVVRRSIR